MSTFGFSLSLLLLTYGLIQLVAGVVEACSRRRDRRKAARWARTSHPCAWRTRAVVGHALQAQPPLTVILEECRLCPAVRLGELEGLWALNRFDELVNLSGEAEILRSML